MKLDIRPFIKTAVTLLASKLGKNQLAKEDKFENSITGSIGPTESFEYPFSGCTGADPLIPDEAIGICDNDPDFVPPPFQVDVLIEIRDLLKEVLAQLKFMEDKE